MWQLDLWRKRGLGLLAADFGPGYLAQDRAARLFLYRGDMAAEWAAYGPQDTRGIVAAFVGGLNAYVALTEARPDLLPPEFAAMGTSPEDMTRLLAPHSASVLASSRLLRPRLILSYRPGPEPAGQAIGASWPTALFRV